MKIILDTNFLLLPAQFKIDVFGELKKFSSQIFTLDVCIDELKKMAESKRREAVQAKISLGLLKKKKIKVIRTRGKNADRAILKYVKMIKQRDNKDISGCDVSVATNDRKLIKDLKSNGIRIIRLRQRKYLVMV